MLDIDPKNAYVVEDAEAGLIAAQKGNFSPVYIPENAQQKSLPMDFNFLQFYDADEFHLHLIKKNFEKSL